MFISKQNNINQYIVQAHYVVSLIIQYTHLVYTEYIDFFNCISFPFLFKKDNSFIPKLTKCTYISYFIVDISMRHLLPIPTHFTGDHFAINVDFCLIILTVSTHLSINILISTMDTYHTNLDKT